MIREAIILAGGLGTRLRSVVSDLPKCMAPVAGRPFLYFVIEQLKRNGIDRFIFSLGYKHEAIEAWLQEQYPSLHISSVVEDEPLGTGGAIKLACSKASGEHVLILNGDTFFNIDLDRLSRFHQDNKADCTLSLKPMIQFDRYGVVELQADHRIIAFKEKQYYEAGFINGGIYALHAKRFLQENLPVKFSFEKEYLEAYFPQRNMFGLIQDEYFIDIGIPEDYERAQHELRITN
ncbi:MAG TPA: nucleotidyltransferase family protein [Ferruginibacter sp.]|nr:nucleotidyltransferase family protein [Ferruginibacter sp.]